MPSYYTNSLQPPPPTPWACGTYLCCPPNLVAAGVSTSSENPLGKHLKNTTPTGRIKASAMTVGNIYFLHFSLQMSWFFVGWSNCQLHTPWNVESIEHVAPFERGKSSKPIMSFLKVKRALSCKEGGLIMIHQALLMSIKFILRGFL